MEIIKSYSEHEEHIQKYIVFTFKVLMKRRDGDTLRRIFDVANPKVAVRFNDNNPVSVRIETESKKILSMALMQYLKFKITPYKMNKRKIFNDAKALYINLEQAYEIAGELRDSFTGMEDNLKSGLLKEQCNIIRDQLYKLRELKGKFLRLIDSIEEK